MFVYSQLTLLIQNLYIANEGESPVILAGKEERRIFIRISRKLFIAETGNVRCLKRTGICLFTWLSKNKTECTAKRTRSLQNPTSAQAKLLLWDKLFSCPAGATHLKKQKTVFPLEVFILRWMSVCLSKGNQVLQKNRNFFLNCFAPWSEEN